MQPHQPLQRQPSDFSQQRGCKQNLNRIKCYSFPREVIDPEKCKDRCPPPPTSTDKPAASFAAPAAGFHGDRNGGARGRTPGRTARRVGLARPPRPATCRAHARCLSGKARRPRPCFLTPNHPLEGRRRPSPEPPCCAPRWDRLPLRGPRPGWSRIPSPASQRGPGRATLSHGTSAGPAQSSPCPHLSRLRPDVAPAPGKGVTGDQSGAGKRESGLEQQDPDLEAGMGSGREEEERKDVAAENPKAGRPPPRWDRPATASCQGSASQLQPEEKSEPPLQLRRDQPLGPGSPGPGPPFCSPASLLTRTLHLQGSLAAGTGPAPAPAAGPPQPPPPSARFQIEIPWLGPSEDSERQPRPLAAEAPPAPPPDAPPARKPPRASPRPRPQATPPGRPFPRDSPRGGPGTRAGKTRLASRAALVNDG
ncbi:proline-rich protein 2-like [Felis catus]|uniref:proline-rich protein 2-like n=1 Tax=Felis catus TaxID=9685 RepID=UPI001D1A2CD3|nr:proline-rich protein 2-like [Felis catus]